MAKELFLFTSYGILLFGLASAFQGEISISGDKEIGGDVVITCSWTLSQNEAFVHVILRSLPVPSGASPFYYQFNNGVLYAVPGIHKRDNRISADSFNVSSQRAVMRITNVQCADDRMYSCYFSYATANGASSYEKTSYLTVKGAHELPVVTLKPSSLHPVEKYYFAYEGVAITATCSADLGWHGPGSLAWVIRLEDRTQIIKQDDPQLKPQYPDTTREGDINCTQYVKQSFRFSAVVMRQAIILSCFVVNSLYANKTRDFCTDGEAEMCGQSPAIWFLHKPNLISLFTGMGKALMMLLAIIILLAGATELYTHLSKPKEVMRSPSPKPEPWIQAPPERHESIESEVVEEEEENEESSTQYSGSTLTK